MQEVGDGRSAVNKLGVIRANGEFRLIATKPINAGEFVIEINGDAAQCPTKYSVQTGLRNHIDLLGEYELPDILDNYSWRFMNHHCEPNTYVRDRSVVALRGIQPWEDITFNYNTTEYDIAVPFQCSCCSEFCCGTISGFCSLPAKEQARIAPWLAPYLRSMVSDSLPASPFNRFTPDGP